MGSPSRSVGTSPRGWHRGADIHPRELLHLSGQLRSLQFLAQQDDSSDSEKE